MKDEGRERVRQTRCQNAKAPFLSWDEKIKRRERHQGSSDWKWHGPRDFNTLVHPGYFKLASLQSYSILHYGEDAGASQSAEARPRSIKSSLIYFHYLGIISGGNEGYTHLAHGRKIHQRGKSGRYKRRKAFRWLFLHNRNPSSRKSNKTIAHRDSIPNPLCLIERYPSHACTVYLLQQ